LNWDGYAKRCFGKDMIKLDKFKNPVEWVCGKLWYDIQCFLSLHFLSHQFLDANRLLS
jgi:hypothetical protein